MDKKSLSAEQIRRKVRSAYGRWATNRRSCCGVHAGQRNCCPESASPMSCIGVNPHVLGYDEQEIEALPSNVAVMSFGCGNPLAFADVAPSDVVVDLGCGVGLDLLLAREHVGPKGRVIGIDMTEAMIEQARRNILAAGYDNIEVRQGTIENMPVESEIADWIISNCVINLSPEKTRVFAEMYRVLKPGGCILISDIVAEDLPPELRADPALICACIGGAISADEYCAGLQRHGFEEVTIRARHVYSLEELQAIWGRPEEGSSSCCGVANAKNAYENDFWRSLDGKIASAQIFARKPR